MKIFLVIIFIFTFIGCKNAEKSTSFDVKKFVSEFLKSDSIPKEKFLVLLISEGMCSECINKEFINLKEHRKVLDNIIVVGIFTNKRYFLSSVNALKPKMKIFCDFQKVNQKVVIQNPLYFVYDKQKEQVSNIFTPNPCRIASTFEYLKNVKENILP